MGVSFFSAALCPNSLTLGDHWLVEFMWIYVTYNRARAPFMYAPMLLIQCPAMCYGSIIFTLVDIYCPWLSFSFVRNSCLLGHPSLRGYTQRSMPHRIVTDCCVYTGLGYATAEFSPNQI